MSSPAKHEGNAVSASNEFDWEWAKRTGGNLTRAQQLRVAGRTLALIPSSVPGAVRYRLGRRGAGRLNFDDVRLPDSKLATAAEEEARDTLPPWLFNHSMRTYFFARVLTQIDGIKVDDELAYAGSLLHDRGLDRPTPGRCFTVVGGERAVAVAEAVGVDPKRAQAVGAAASDHANAGIDHHLDIPGGYVLAGSLVDCMAKRLDEFDPTWVAALLTRYPRLNLKRELITALHAEARAVPNGRLNVVVRLMPASLVMGAAPYSD
ncbi:phosphohydrolase [Nocardia sp. NPDC051030]|uniref:phosphohydrolase n=1 Tax=Nocardia sp. NPDC051030 TaxID=3155162 RepID=UPI00341EB0D2